MAINIPLKAVFDDRELKKGVSTLNDFGKKASLAVAAGFAAAGYAAFAFGKDAIAAAEGVEVANNRLEQVAKSMGIFGSETQAVTDRLIKYAEANEMTLGVDAEVLKSTQAKLLTFSELAASADEVGGMFDRATLASADLAAVFGGTADDSAVRLGKALQDPIKGITSLTKVGVTFTAEQKNLIASLVESGQTLEAQDMILSAIEQQVGGTSAATATASEKMALAFGNLSEQVGAALLPVLDELMPVLEELLPVIGEQLVTAVNQIDFATIVEEIASFAGWVIENIDGLVRLAQVLGIAAAAFLTMSGILSAVKIATGLMTIAQAGLAAMFGTTATATGIATTALKLFKAALITTGIGAIVVALGYVAEGFLGAAEKGNELNNVDTTNLETNLSDIETQLDNVGIAAGNAKSQILSIPDVREGTGPSFGRFGIEPGASPFVEVVKKTFSGSTSATRDVVGDFLDGFKDEIAKQTAAIKLGDLGLSSALVEEILGSGADWKEIYDYIIKGGKGAADEIQNLFNEANGALEELGKTAEATEEQLAAMAQIQLDFYDRMVAKYEENQRQIAELNTAVQDTFNSFNQSAMVTESLGAMEQSVVDLTSALRETVAAQETSLISARNQKKLQDYLNIVEGQMRAVAQQRDQLETELSEVKSVYKSFFDSIVGDVDITSFKGKSDSIIKQLRKQVEAQGKFQEDIKKLRASGLSDTALQQIQKAGVQAGGATAAALLTGGQSAIDEVNSLYSQLGDIATSATEAQLAPMYGAGVDLADGLIAGLEARQAQLEAVATMMAVQFQTTFEKALGQGTNRVSAPASPEEWAAFSTAYAAAQAQLISTLRPGELVQYSPGDLVNGIQLPSQPSSPNPGGRGNITINLTAGLGVNGADLGKQIVDEIRKHERRSGQVFVPAVQGGLSV